MNFHLVLRHHTAPIVDSARVIEHLAWMRRQHERGTVLISGPVRTAPPGSMYCAFRHTRTQSRSPPPTHWPATVSESRSSNGMSTKYWGLARLNRRAYEMAMSADEMIAAGPRNRH